jgi:hypothetical protein
MLLFSYHQFRDCLANHSAAGEFVLLILSCVPALLGTKKLWSEFNEEKGLKRAWRITELVLLWLLPVVVFCSTKATDWASEDSVRDVKIQSSNDLNSAHEEILGLSNQVRQVALKYNEATNALTEAQRVSADAKLELEKSKNRHIKPEDKLKFIELTKDFPKMDIEVVTGTYEGETHRYAKEIREMLNGAKYGTNGEPVLEWDFASVRDDDAPISFDKFDLQFDWYGTNYAPRTIQSKGFFVGPNNTAFAIGNDVTTKINAVGWGFMQIGVNVGFGETDSNLKPGEFVIFVLNKIH